MSHAGPASGDCARNDPEGRKQSCGLYHGSHPHPRPHRISNTLPLLPQLFSQKETAQEEEEEASGEPLAGSGPCSGPPKVRVAGPTQMPRRDAAPVTAHGPSPRRPPASHRDHLDEAHSWCPPHQPQGTTGDHRTLTGAPGKRFKDPPRAGSRGCRSRGASFSAGPAGWSCRSSGLICTEQSLF